MRTYLITVGLVPVPIIIPIHSLIEDHFNLDLFRAFINNPSQSLIVFLHGHWCDRLLKNGRAMVIFIPIMVCSHFPQPISDMLGFAQAEGPKTISPRSAIFNCAGTGNGGAPQLAMLEQGPPFDLRVSSVSRSEGGRESDRELLPGDIVE